MLEQETSHYLVVMGLPLIPITFLQPEPDNNHCQAVAKLTLLHCESFNQLDLPNKLRVMSDINQGLFGIFYQYQSAGNITFSLYEPGVGVEYNHERSVVSNTQTDV